MTGREIEREAPRVRDMPAPRRNESAAGAVMRMFAWPYRAILALLVWSRIRAWQLTLLFLAIASIAGCCSPARLTVAARAAASG